MSRDYVVLGGLDLLWLVLVDMMFIAHCQLTNFLWHELIFGQKYEFLHLNSVHCYPHTTNELDLQVFLGPKKSIGCSCWVFRNWEKVIGVE